MNCILVVIIVMMRIAFLTLYERKILRCSQLRKGPSKLGVIGLGQPFRDALKLFFKEITFLSKGNFSIFLLRPSLNLRVVIIMWLSYPSWFGSLRISLAVVFIMCCLSLRVYPILGASWASNSKYPLLGGLRAIAQTISYEVRFIILILGLVVINHSYSLMGFFPPFNQWYLFLFFPIRLMWLVSALAETNRVPFDFVEGESELVSGFNTEYMAGGFAIFFIAEYGSILFIRFLFCIFFLHPTLFGLVNRIKTILVVFMYIWIRATLPRLRYDLLMRVAWKVFLPLSLAFLFLSVVLC